MFICLYYYYITSVFFFFSFLFFFFFCDSIIDCLCLFFAFFFFCLFDFFALRESCCCCCCCFPAVYSHSISLFFFFLEARTAGKIPSLFLYRSTLSNQCCLNLFLFSFSSVPFFFFFALCLRVRTAALFSTPSTTSSFTVDLVPARRAFFPLPESPSLHPHERPCTAAAVATQAPQQTCYTVSVAAMPAAPSRVGATNSWQLRPPQQRTILTHPPPSES